MKKIYELDISSIKKKNCNTYEDLFSLDDDSISPLRRIKKQFYLNNKEIMDNYENKFKNNTNDKIIIKYNNKYYLLHVWNNSIKEKSCDKCDFEKCLFTNCCVADLLGINIANNCYLERKELFKLEFAE